MDKVFSTDRTHLCMVDRVNAETGSQIGMSTLEGWYNWRFTFTFSHYNEVAL
jgi:hypothetical protein